MSSPDDPTADVPPDLADPPVGELDAGGEPAAAPPDRPDSVPAEDAPGGAVPSDLADPPTP
jgi:hypothetical protein